LDGDFADSNYAPQIDQSFVMDLILAQQLDGVQADPAAASAEYNSMSSMNSCFYSFAVVLPDRISCNTLRCDAFLSNPLHKTLHLAVL